MGAEAIERPCSHYLGDASRRGAPLPGGFDGAAGGAPCGDLVRISLDARRRPDRAGQLRRRGLRRGARRRRRGRRAGRGRRGARRGARSAPTTIAAQLGGLGPQGRHAVELAADALHRALAGARRLGRGASPQPPAAGERVLVALSGGVDSAVAALRERERGAEVVAVTLKLWADQRTDAEQELLLAGWRCSAPAGSPTRSGSRT